MAKHFPSHSNNSPAVLIIYQVNTYLHLVTYMVTWHMITVKEPPTGPGISPPPSSVEAPHNPDRSKDSTNSDAALETHRCQFTFSDGRRCRTRSAQFCVDHASKRNGVGAEGAPDDGLAGLCADLT